MPQSNRLPICSGVSDKNVDSEAQLDFDQVMVERAISDQISRGATMLRFVHPIKFALIVAAALALVGFSTESRAHTGTVHLKIVKVGFIVGLGGGHGTLFYEGHRYRLGVGGVGIGSLGIAGAELRGIAYNLRSPADIAGTYGVAGAGGAFVGGAAVARLQNEKGVILELHGVQMGFQVTLGLGGLTISLQ
jgi:hypothetical protein